MSAHKTNPIAIQGAAGRPTCATCPHFFPETTRPGHGVCRFYPPTAFLFIMQSPPVLGTLVPAQEITKSSHPPQFADRWCGQHPDFMRWWMEHREEFARTQEIREAVVEGSA